MTCAVNYIRVHLGVNMRKFSTIFMKLHTAAFLPVVTALSIGLATLTSTNAARASTIFTNFPASQTYDCCKGYYAVTGSAAAFSFVSPGSYAVTQIDLGLTAPFNPGRASASVSLWTNVSGSLGAYLGDWTVSGIANNAGSSITTISGITGVYLQAGVSYFLQVTSFTDYVAWGQNTTGYKSTRLYNGVRQDVNFAGAFDILGDPATPPLPTPIGPVGLPGLVLALGGLMAWRRRLMASA